MPLIATTDADRLRAHFDKTLAGPVTIHLFLEEERLFRTADECGGCGPTRQLMVELAATSSRFHLEVHELPGEQALAERMGVHRVPAIVLAGAGKGTLRFLGAPLGFELTGFLEDIVDVSRGRTDLDEASRGALRALDRDVHVQLFVSSDCPVCPAAARLAHKLAIESERVAADVIEVDEFPELAERYGIERVPTLVVDGRVAMTGFASSADLVQQLLPSPSART